MVDMRMVVLGEGVPRLGETREALALVRSAMNQLAIEVESEANTLSGEELRQQQALALPRRAAALRDLSVALRELIGLERRLLGVDDSSRLLKAYAAMAALADQRPGAKTEGKDGQ